MKNIINALFFFGALSVFPAQISIGKTVAVGSETPPAVANQYVSLEFGNYQNGVKGIILPWVTSESAVTATSPVPGTLIFDSATQKVKLAVANTSDATTATSWMDLSVAAETPATPFKNDTSLIENTNAKIIIGNSTSVAPGILVLETPDPVNAPKAMVLPRVSNYTDIVNPAAGMIVYLTSSNRLAVFNGKEWSFWAPEP